MQEGDDTWRVDAFALGLRTGPKLYAKMQTWLVVIESLPTLYRMAARLPPPLAVLDREVPLQIYAVLTPLRDRVLFLRSGWMRDRGGRCGRRRRPGRR